MSLIVKQLLRSTLGRCSQVRPTPGTSLINQQLRKSSSAPAAASAAVPKSEPLPPPPSSTIDEKPISVSAPIGQDKKYDERIVKLVNDISGLTLIQVADLNELLKKTLNIPDTPMMMGGMMPMMGQAAPAEEEAEVVTAKVQTAFTVKLLKFDEAKKVALIKEVKNLLEGYNLVQAKKFVESAPTTVKADIAKDDAEKLAAALTAAGATCEIV